MKNSIVTGYSIEGTGTIHFFTADQRRSAYAAARDMAAMRGKNVTVKVIRKEKPLEAAEKPVFKDKEWSTQKFLKAPQRGVGVQNSSGIDIHPGDRVQVRHGTAAGTVTQFRTADHQSALVGHKVEFAAVQLDSGRIDEFPIDNLVVLKWAESLETLEAPEEEALEGSGPSVPEVYEVTVPVRVIVRVGRYHITSERPTVANEWNGFFSEAEENSGVWDIDEQAWGSENSDVVTISEVARTSVQNHLDTAYFK